jgi:hypothetical protein
MSPADSLLSYLQKMVHRLSVSTITGIQKKSVVKGARLHELKAIRLMAVLT